MTAPVVSLDLRDLAPPEPMHRILDALATLSPGERMEAWTPFHPVPLLAILQADGHAFTVEPVDDGYHLMIVCASHAHGADRPA